MASRGSSRGFWRSSPPRSFADERWPESSFPSVTDPDIRAVVHLAQSIARVLLARLGILRISEEELARRADVNIDQVRNALSGSAWVSLYTAQRLLLAVDAELEVLAPEDPRKMAGG